MRATTICLVVAILGGAVGVGAQEAEPAPIPLPLAAPLPTPIVRPTPAPAPLPSPVPVPGSRLYRVPAAAAIPEHYLVKLADQATTATQVPSIAATLAARYGGVLTHVYRNRLKGFAVRIPEQGAIAMSNDPLVAVVQQNANGEGRAPVDAALGVAAPPQVQLVTPKDGFPNVSVTINGNDLGSAQETTVLFTPGVPGLRTAVTNAIFVSVPAGAATGPITVSTSAGSAMSMPFLIRPPRALDRIDQRRLPQSCTFTRTANGAGVTAYVIDSGVSSRHDQFAGRIDRLVNCLNADPNRCEIVGSQSPFDRHGTSVASLVLGRDVGVANGARLVSVQVYDSGRFNLADVVKGVDWATADIGAHRPAVVNLSLGFPAASDPNGMFKDAVEGLTDNARVLVAAAAPNTLPTVPLSSCTDDLAPIKDKILMVGATTVRDRQDNGYGPCLALFAPGADSEAAVFGNDDFTIGTFGGTSGATPLVSGVAALYLQGHPAAEAAVVRAAILASATRSVLDVDPTSPNVLLSSRLDSGPAGSPTATPASLTFRIVGGQAPGPQPLTLGSTGAPLEVRVVPSLPSLQLGVPQDLYPDVCSPHVTTPRTITVRVDPTGIAADTTATLTLQANNGSPPLTVPVTIQVVSPNAPRIDAFMPMRAAVRKKVTLTGINLQGATSVTFNGTSALIKSDTATQLVAKVPPGATTGFIVVTTPNGMASTAPRVFTVKPSVPPTVTSFTPASGSAGTTVRIVGTEFDDETTVTFNGAPATVLSVEETLLTVRVPATATTGPVRVANPDGTGAGPTSFVVGTPPAVASFTPSSGPPGTLVSITGSGFVGASNVTFGGIGGAFAVISPNLINATVPGFATTGPIRVTTPTGTATSSGNFTVITGSGSGPVITSFAPASGMAGTLVSIQGNNFSGVNTVTFNGAAAAFVVQSSTSIVATVPTGATTGPIRVATPTGAALSGTNFTVSGVAGPLITGFLPTSGPPGTTVNISGGNFTGATAVTFGGAGAGFGVLGNGALVATVPAFAASGPIRVTTPVGTAMSAGSFTVTPLAGPVISSFTPTSGQPGTGVTVSGANFSGTTSVTFGGVPATFAVQGPSTLTTTAPFGAVTGPITITTPQGTATSGGIFTVTQQAPQPVIAALTPTSGPPGTQVTISGINLQNTIAVTFAGGIGAAFTTLGPNQVIATVPASAPTGPITVTTTVGTATSSQSFTVTSP